MYQQSFAYREKDNGKDRKRVEGGICSSLVFQGC
jgi:hypothetical protein